MKRQPYQYIAVWHPTDKEEIDGLTSKVYSKGIVVARSMYSAYESVAKDLAPVHDNDAEQIEVYIKPFLEKDSCPTKETIANVYSFLQDNTLVYWRSSTASLDDFNMDTFTNPENRTLPNSMYLIDIFNLINDKQKDIL